MESFTYKYHSWNIFKSWLQVIIFSEKLKATNGYIFYVNKIWFNWHFCIEFDFLLIGWDNQGWAGIWDSHHLPLAESGHLTNSECLLRQVSLSVELSSSAGWIWGRKGPKGKPCWIFFLSRIELQEFKGFFFYKEIYYM